MPIALYMNVHVPQAITSQLRCRGIDILPLMMKPKSFLMINY